MIVGPLVLPQLLSQGLHSIVASVFVHILVDSKILYQIPLPNTLSDAEHRCLVSPNRPNGNGSFPPKILMPSPLKCRSSKLGLQVIEDLPLPPIVRGIFIPELNVQVPEQSVRTRARGWNLLFPRNLLHFCNSTICKAETRREVLPTMIPRPNADHPFFSPRFSPEAVWRGKT